MKEELDSSLEGISAADQPTKDHKKQNRAGEV